MWDVLGCCTLSTMLSESKDGVNFAISNKDWTPLLSFKWILTAVPLLIFDISYYVKYQNVTYFPDTEILWKGTVSAEFWGWNLTTSPYLKLISPLWNEFLSAAMLWQCFGKHSWLSSFRLKYKSIVVSSLKGNSTTSITLGT